MLATTGGCASVTQEAKITIHAVDETGHSVPDAKVSIGFVDTENPNAPRNVSGITDANGLFTGEGRAYFSLGADISKEGYYMSGGGIDHLTPGVVRMAPWNPMVTSILRPIGSPTALYAKKVTTDVPVLNQLCGYDLEKGDWVSPYGKGSTPDLTFRIKRDYKSWFDFTVIAELGFSQPLGGLVRMKSPDIARNSVFRWERLAPENGYIAQHVIRFVSHHPDTGISSERSFDMAKTDVGYFFRVRTVADGERLSLANYGKIIGDIGVDPRESKTCAISFLYYYNPIPNSRNLEFDPKQNLFPPGLPGANVTEP